MSLINVKRVLHNAPGGNWRDPETGYTVEFPQNHNLVARIQGVHRSLLTIWHRDGTYSFEVSPPLQRKRDEVPQQGWVEFAKMILLGEKLVNLANGVDTKPQT